MVQNFWSETSLGLFVVSEMETSNWCTHANQTRVYMDETANLRCLICKWLTYHSPWTKICRFFARTHRELGALGVLCSPQVREKLIYYAPGAVFPDDFLKNLYKHCRKNPYILKKFRTFFRHEYQSKGFCKYYWNKVYISQSDYIELFYKH